MRRLALGTLVLALVLVMTVPVIAQDPGQGKTNFTVMNLDPAESATVVAEYVNQSGVVDATKEKPLQPLSPEGWPIADSGLPDGWIGSAVVSSDREITAFGQLLWEDGEFGDGKTAGAYTGFAEGAAKLYLPALFDRDGKQHSRISVQAASSPGGSSVTAELNFYDREGNAAAVNPVTDTIPAGAQATWILGTDIELGTDWKGSGIVTCSDGEIAAVVTTHWKEYSAAYSGVIGGGQKAYLPSLTRRLPAGPWLQYTGCVVQNLDDAAAVDVTVYWYNRAGTLLGSFADSIPANSAHGYNTRFAAGSEIPGTFDVEAVLGTDWNGSVIIEGANPDDEIVAIVNLQWTADHPSGAAGSSYYSEASGYEELFAPASFRRISSGWLQYTGLIVQNVGATTCSNFDVTWTDRAGVDQLSFQDSIPANTSHGYNTKVGADIPVTADPADLGDDFRGSVYIEAPGCSLIAIHNTVWPAWTDSTTYNVYGK